VGRWAASVLLVFLIALPAVAGDLVEEWEGLEASSEEATNDEELARVVLREAAALRANPIDLNTAGVAGLLRLPVDAGVALRIVALREKRGAFASLDDLAGAAGIPSDIVARLRPYVTVGAVTPGPDLPAAAIVGAPPAGPDLPTADDGPPRLAWSVRARTWCRTDDEEESWAEDLGSPLALAGSYVRIRVEPGEDLRLGVGMERDPGEASLVDHAALFVEWRPEVFARDPVAGAGDGYGVGLVGGDLSGRWAQGLLFGASVFPSETSFPRRSARARGHDRASESARRGVLLGLARGRVVVHALAARTRLDAAVEGGAATSVRTSGLHRTDGEREGAGALVERLLGARARVRTTGALEIGVSWIRAEYDPPLTRGDEIRRRFAPQGDEIAGASLDARIEWHDLAAGIEATRSSGGGRALLGAARLSAASIRVRVGFARISKEFAAPLGAGAPHCSSGRNATVAWMTAEYVPSGRWGASLGGFVRGRPWRTYHLDMAPLAWEVRAAWDCVLGGGWSVRVSRATRVESDERDAADGDCDSDRTVLVRSVRTRVALRSRGSCPISLAVSSGDARSDDDAFGDNIGVAGSVTVDVARTAVTLGLAVNAASGDAPGVGHYEPGLPGEFGPRSLNGSGTRWYIRGQQVLRNHVALTARLAGGPERGRLEFGVGLDLTR